MQHQKSPLFKTTVHVSLYSLEFTHSKVNVNRQALLHLQNVYPRQLLTNQITHPASQTSRNVATLDTGGSTGESEEGGFPQAQLELRSQILL